MGLTKYDVCFFIENEEVLEEVRTKLLEAGEPIYEKCFTLSSRNRNLNYLFCDMDGDWWLGLRGDYAKPLSELPNYIGK